MQASSASTSAAPSGYATPTNAFGPSSLTGQQPPTTRSRTLLFLSYRDSVPRASRTSYPPRQFRPLVRDEAQQGKGIGKRKGKGRYDGDAEERAGLMEDMGEDGNDAVGGGDVTLEMDTLPPKWVDVSDQVEDNLTQVRPMMARLDKLHAKHLLPGFTDRSAEEKEIERLADQITKNFINSQALIRKLSAQTASMIRSGEATQRDVRMARNVQTALAIKVQEASTLFRKKQTVYMQKLRGHDIRHQDLLAASGQLQLKDSYAAVEEDMKMSRNLASQSQAFLLEEEDSTSQDAEICQRDREITEIARSISELAELFKDLSNLVIDQGTMLDRIDYNIETLSANVEEAVKELEVAEKYQRSTGKRKCIFLLLLLILLCVVILILKPFVVSRSSSASPPSPTHAVEPSIAALSPRSTTFSDGIVQREWRSMSVSALSERRRVRRSEAASASRVRRRWA